MRGLGLIGLFAAAPLLAGSGASGDPAALPRALQGKTPGAELACIRPDLSAQPEIHPGLGIVYRDARTTYLARLHGNCPELRRDRTIIVRGDGTKLCRNDPVRIIQATGADFGFCTIAGFTPYTK